MQPSGLNLAALAGSRREAISVVPPAERQGYAAGAPSASSANTQVGASMLAERPSYVSAGISGAMHRYQIQPGICPQAERFLIP